MWSKLKRWYSMGFRERSFVGKVIWVTCVLPLIILFWCTVGLVYLLFIQLKTNRIGAKRGYKYKV